MFTLIRGSYALRAIDYTTSGNCSIAKCKITQTVIEDYPSFDGKPRSFSLCRGHRGTIYHGA